MRALSMNEIEVVSGGESPCWSLPAHDPCRPPPTAKEIGDAADALSLTLQAKALKSTGKKAIVYSAAALAADAVSIIAGWFEDAENNPPPGGQTHNTPPGTGR